MGSFDIVIMALTLCAFCYLMFLALGTIKDIIRLHSEIERELKGWKKDIDDFRRRRHESVRTDREPDDDC